MDAEYTSEPMSSGSKRSGYAQCKVERCNDLTSFATVPWSAQTSIDSIGCASKSVLAKARHRKIHPSPSKGQQVVVEDPCIQSARCDR
jgi:hypothetical protein